MYLTEVQTYINDHQGGTFRLREDGRFDVAEHTDGYYVARSGAEVQVATADLHYSALNAYVADRSAVLAVPDNFFGVWLDGDTAYLDVSTHVVNRHMAEALGRKNQQLAIWDVAEGRAYTL